jgi:hypothetical protein
MHKTDLDYEGTCLTLVMGAGSNRHVEGILPGWSPIDFLELHLPAAVGWRLGDTLVLLPEVTGIPPGRIYVKGQYVMWVPLSFHGT